MDTHLNQGTVYKKSKGIYTVHAVGGAVIQCTISTRLRQGFIASLVYCRLPIGIATSAFKRASISTRRYESYLKLRQYIVAQQK